MWSLPFSNKNIYFLRCIWIRLCTWLLENSSTAREQSYLFRKLIMSTHARSVHLFLNMATPGPAKASFGTTGLMPGLFCILARNKWNQLCHLILVNIHSWPGSKLQEIKTCVRQHREQKQGFNRISTNQFLAAATCSTSGTYTIYQQQLVKHTNFPHPAHTNCSTMHHFNNLTCILCSFWDQFLSGFLLITN